MTKKLIHKVRRRLLAPFRVLQMKCKGINKYVSQYGQDAFVVGDLFNFKRRGIFIDIGANDGIRFSNTYILESKLGWTGICVEPIRAIFDQLRSNRSCETLNACVTDNPSESITFLEIAGPDHMLSGALDSISPAHLERVKDVIKVNGGSLNFIDCKAISLRKLFNDSGLTHINYLSIDVEGGGNGSFAKHRF